MFSLFKQERDSQGREVIEIGMNPTYFKAAAVGMPLVFLGMAYYATARMPGGMPWYLIAAPIVVAAIAYPVSAWISSRSRIRITIDSGAGKLLVFTSGAQSDVRIADLEKAEFISDSDSEGTTVYRLEFVMKNGQRVPATESYTNAYSLRDQAKTVGVINGALGRGMA